MERKDDKKRGREAQDRQPIDERNKEAFHRSEPHPAPQNQAPQQNMMGDLPPPQPDDTHGRAPGDERTKTEFRKDTPAY